MAELLIVDDELDVREFAANFFRKRDIDVATASSGAEALKIIDKYKPQLILLDIKMEEMDGVKTLEKIREKGNAVKVIMVTGKEPDEEDAFAKCQKLGALGYIHKPLKLDELEKAVLEILKK